jgi:hypothetical protein
MNRNCVARLKISTASSLLRWISDITLLCWISDITLLCWISDITSPANGKVYQLLHLKPFMSESHLPNVFKCLTAKTNSLRQNFLNPPISTSWLKHGLKFLNPTTLDFEKSYAVISVKIFSALSREKK